MLNNLGLWGKLPSHGDFIDHQAATSLWRAFDDWLQHGLLQASQDPGFNASYLEGGGYTFLFTPRNSSQSLLGYIHPSRDTVGRAFPIISGFEIERQYPQWEWIVELPRKYHSIMRRHQEAIHDAIEGKIDRHALIDRLESISQLEPAPPSINSSPIHVLTEGVSGMAEANRLYLLLMNVIELIQPLRVNLSEYSTLGFRFPASREIDSASQFIGYWLELLATLVGEANISPTFFWRLPAVDFAPSSSLLAFFQPPPPKVFGDIIPLERESDYICDMAEINEHKLDRAGSIIPGSLKATLDSAGANLSDLLHQMY